VAQLIFTVDFVISNTLKTGGVVTENIKVLVTDVYIKEYRLK
jgi:hypothetical protein